jgi:hypothetical protein
MHVPKSRKYLKMRERKRNNERKKHECYGKSPKYGPATAQMATEDHKTTFLD